MPGALRIDRDHAGAERKRFRWSVVVHHFQGRAAFEDVDQLVAREMGFPMTRPRKLRDTKAAVTVGGQSRAAAPSLRHGRSRGPAAENRELREFCIEIDDGGRRISRFAFRRWLCRPRIVDIELDALAGKRRRTEMRVALGRKKAVPGTLRNDVIIPALRAKLLGGPSSQTISSVAVPWPRQRWCELPGADIRKCVRDAHREVDRIAREIPGIEASGPDGGLLIFTRADQLAVDHVCLVSPVLAFAPSNLGDPPCGL